MQATFYKGRDNANNIQLKDNGVVVDHTQISRVILELNDGTKIDSNVNPTYFTLAQSTQFTIKLGATSLAADGYTCRIIIYDPSHTSGIVWDTIPLTILD